jgi:hypothetical protein
VRPAFRETISLADGRTQGAAPTPVLPDQFQSMSKYIDAEGTTHLTNVVSFDQVSGRWESASEHATYFGGMNSGSA